MKALTIRQPWAQLTLLLDKGGKAFKQVETRSRNTNYRGRLAIHAGMHQDAGFFVGMDEKNLTFFQEAGLGNAFALGKLPYGAVIGEVTLLDSVPIDKLTATSLYTDQEIAFGDWSVGKGRYGWILGDPVMYEKPIPARGRLGLWNWEVGKK